MMKLVVTKLFLAIAILGLQTSLMAGQATITKVSGDVKIRRGLDENWQPATAGMLLDIIDTILTLEGSAVLELEEGTFFTLGNNSILDVGDLRKITKREMFLFLMADKIDRIRPRKQKAKLRVGDVTVVHGESRAGVLETDAEENAGFYSREINGAKALYEQKFYPNAVVKFHKILAKFPTVDDCGEVQFYLGNAFELLNEPGQAADAYQIVIQQGGSCTAADAKERVEQAQNAIKRLSP